MASSDDQEQHLSEAAKESLKLERDRQANSQTQDNGKFYSPGSDPQ
jgi:hypothetical protein